MSTKVRINENDNDNDNDDDNDNDNDGDNDNELIMMKVTFFMMKLMITTRKKNLKSSLIV